MLATGMHPKTGKYIDLEAAIAGLPEWLNLTPLEQLIYGRVIDSRNWQAEQARNPKVIHELTSKDVAAGLRGVPLARTYATSVTPHGEGCGVNFGGDSLMAPSLQDASVEATVLRGIANGNPPKELEEYLDTVFSSYAHDAGRWNAIEAAAPYVNASELVQQSCLLASSSLYDTALSKRRTKEYAWLALIREGLSLVPSAIQAVAFKARQQLGLGPRVTDAPPSGSCLAAQFVHYLGTASDATEFARLTRVARVQGKSLWGHGANNVGNRTAEHVAGSLPKPKQVVIGGAASLYGILHGAAADDGFRQILGELEYFGSLPDYLAHKAYVLKIYFQEGMDLAGNGHGLFKLADVFESRVRLAMAVGKEVCPDYLGFQMACQRAGIPMELILESNPEAKDCRMPNVDLVLPFVVAGSGLLGKDFRPTSVAELGQIEGLFTAMFAMWRIIGWVLETSINDGTMIRTAPVKV